MSICKNCGVDLGEGNDKCPLCDPSDPGKKRVASPADLFRVSRIENSRHLYEILMLILVSGVIITIAIDAVFGKRMSWSLTTTTCICYVTAMVSGIYLLRGKPYLMIAVTASATILFLWLIDHFTGDHGWSRSLGCPMAISGALLMAAVIFLSSLSKYRGLNLLATILVALALFAVITEYLIDRLVTAVFTPQWSVVTAVSLLIIAMIFIFIHYRLKRGRSLGRLFHI
ncbi:MAG: DUF6320 domain-containing protein [Bacteroidales bacterium]